ncbi:MAG TPA: flagellar hook protein FlgE [Gammaproteobacteria bacterium]|nr:flagellar hook protein FlgE [Gammaproteobacteria bacterium]
MSLNTSVSGINAAQSGLDVVSNDLANANTTAFKAGSARFGDIYPPAGSNSPGIGVKLQDIERNFAQGQLQTTSNPLDLAVQGKGFFIINHAGAQRYSRDGQFHLNPNNELVNAAGDAVMGYTINPSGAPAGVLSKLTVGTGNLQAKATGSIGVVPSLNQNDPAISSAFNQTNPNTYDESTSVVAYDSLGDANHVQLYFVKNQGSGTATSPDTWTVYAQPRDAQGNNVGSAANLTTLQFNGSGQLTGGSNATLNVNWGNGSGASAINFDFTGATLAAQQFAVNGITNDGYPPGQFNGATVAKDGTVNANYTNGQKVAMGKLAMAAFINEQGLSAVSNNEFVATRAAGQPAVNTPGVGLAGSIASGKLEQSNVNMSNSLVRLIQFQQTYQANTSAIQTDKQDVQRLMQI